MDVSGSVIAYVCISAVIVLVLWKKPCCGGKNKMKLGWACWSGCCFMYCLPCWLVNWAAFKRADVRDSLYSKALAGPTMVCLEPESVNYSLVLDKDAKSALVRSQNMNLYQFQSSVAAEYEAAPGKAAPEKSFSMV